jgi:hypothetical protein
LEIGLRSSQPRRINLCEMEPPRGPAEVSVTFFLLQRISAMTSHFELNAEEHGCGNYQVDVTLLRTTSLV